jgi:uncharacterized repeat protein (TIGR01451 family)
MEVILDGSRRDVGYLRVLAALALLAYAGAAAAMGTGAGSRIDNAAQASYQVAGVDQPTVTSNTVSVVVDELLDVVVTSTDAGVVAVTSPSNGSALTFSVTNTGNGSEAFRLAIDSALAGDDFDPQAPVVYLESNGTPGLQVGGGGDTPYVAGANDPLLAHDATVTVYVSADAPGGLSAGAIGNLSLRAVSLTVYGQTGTDDPANPAFPTPGTTYAGLGDPAVGGGTTNAVVGASYSSTTLQLLAQGGYRVTSALVTLAKSVISITDPFGGATIVPGSVIRYQITVTVAGSGAVDNLVVDDPVPPELAFVSGSLAVSVLPAGEQPDDDFLPAGTDHTGFDGPNRSVVVTLGSVAAGGTPNVITFDATLQ